MLEFEYDGRMRITLTIDDEGLARETGPAPFPRQPAPVAIKAVQGAGGLDYTFRRPWLEWPADRVDEAFISVTNLEEPLGERG